MTATIPRAQDRRSLSPAERAERTERVASMHRAGVAQRLIAEETGLSLSSVSREIHAIKAAEADDTTTDTDESTESAGTGDAEDLIAQAKARIKEAMASHSPIPRQEITAIVASLQGAGLEAPAIMAATGFAKRTVQDVIERQQDDAREEAHGPIGRTAFWTKLQVHPAAHGYPMMSDAELDEMARDIKANGLMEQIALWGAYSLKPVLLDGRNRLKALGLLGITNPFKAPLGRDIEPVRIIDSTDGISAAAYVKSLNAHRRHLTSAQKRKVVADYLKANPTVSDRQVAKEAGVSDKTVASERRDLESRSEIPDVDKRTDTKGRQQPSKKPVRDPALDAAAEQPGTEEIAADAELVAIGNTLGNPPQDRGFDSLPPLNQPAPTAEPEPDEAEDVTHEGHSEPANPEPSEAKPPRRKETAGVRRWLTQMMIQLTSIALILEKTAPAEVDADAHRDELKDIRAALTQISKWFNAVEKNGRKED